jgi:DnaK suppressor protein
MTLDRAQKDVLARLLERERDRLLRRLQRFGADLDSYEGAYSQHMAESASALTERETAFLLASEEGRRLLSVNRALERLVRDPRFGLCRTCGEPVGYSRLEAVPYAELCIGCKRIEEETGSGRGD